LYFYLTGAHLTGVDNVPDYKIDQKIFIGIRLRIVK